MLHKSKLLFSNSQQIQCTETNPIHGISYREGCYPSRPTWGTKSLRNCAPPPQVPSKGYHIGRAVSHPGLPGVLRRFGTALLYPRSNPRDIISGGLFPIQAYLGYYVASELRSSTPGPIHGICHPVFCERVKYNQRGIAMSEFQNKSEQVRTSHASH
jgi:hypothetical protein